MKKYLFTTLPTNDLGLLTRSLPIAHELRNLGHEIVFCSPGRAPRRLVSEAGFDNLLPDQAPYYIISGELSIENFSRFLRSRHLKRDAGILFSIFRQGFQALTAEIWNIDHFMYVFGMWHEGFLRANVEALLEIIRKYDPDVIVDFWNPFACLAARAGQKPLITVIQADMHPQSQGFIWWKKKPDDIPTTVPAANKVMAEYHLPPITSIGDLLTGDLTLVLGQPETDPLPDTAQVTYLGPILWQKQDEPLPDWLKELRTNRPVIWLYPGNLKYVKGAGTPFDSAVVLQACIEALANEAVRVVLTTGYNTLPRQFVPLPPNFRHEPYAPGLAMAEKSDLLIHHGGYGSCQTGLYAGKPSLIIPTYSERESNARRIAAAGAGDFVVPQSDRSGRKKHVSAQEVHTKVFNILSDGTFADNARRIGEHMKSYGGAPNAARLIDSLV